jgi:hypothetical protein
MRKFVILHYRNKDHKREIDDEGRIILGDIGHRNQEPVYRTLRTKIKGNTDEERNKDLRDRISRLIDQGAPFESAEFVIEE